MDLVGDVNDSLNERLVPFTDCTGELGSWVRGVRTSYLDSGNLVEEASRSTRPEVVSTVGLGEEVVEDLAVDLECNLLGEDLGELDLSVHAVVGVQVLSELW